MPLPQQQSAGTNALPWTIAAIALLSLVALFAGQRFGRSAPDRTQPLGASGGQGAMGRGPDLSAMSPAEQRARLYDRVMGYAARGRADSIAFFAPMAIMAYQQLGPLGLDEEYDFGRIAEVAGDAELVAEQAETILRGEPRHLLGLILGARAARMRNDSAAERRYYEQFLEAHPVERTNDRPEYIVHAEDIEQARQDARRLLGR